MAKNIKQPKEVTKRVIKPSRSLGFTDYKTSELNTMAQQLGIDFSLLVSNSPERKS